MYQFTSELQEQTLLHFKAGEKAYRLLTHFYNYIHFTDPAIDNYYKRFVRDFLRYQDPIFCAAVSHTNWKVGTYKIRSDHGPFGFFLLLLQGKIVKALQLEGRDRGFTVDEEGGGGYSALHIRDPGASANLL